MEQDWKSWSKSRYKRKWRSIRNNRPRPDIVITIVVFTIVEFARGTSGWRGLITTHLHIQIHRLYRVTEVAFSYSRSNLVPPKWPRIGIRAERATATAVPVGITRFNLISPRHKWKPATPTETSCNQSWHVVRNSNDSIQTNCIGGGIAKILPEGF